MSQRLRKNQGFTDDSILSVDRQRGHDYQGERLSRTMSAFSPLTSEVEPQRPHFLQPVNRRGALSPSVEAQKQLPHHYSPHYFTPSNNVEHTFPPPYYPTKHARHSRGPVNLGEDVSLQIPRTPSSAVYGSNSPASGQTNIPIKYPSQSPVCSPNGSFSISLSPKISGQGSGFGTSPGVTEKKYIDKMNYFLGSDLIRKATDPVQNYGQENLDSFWGEAPRVQEAEVNPVPDFFVLGAALGNHDIHVNATSPWKRASDGPLPEPERLLMDIDIIGNLGSKPDWDEDLGGGLLATDSESGFDSDDFMDEVPMTTQQNRYSPGQILIKELKEMSIYSETGFSTEKYTQNNHDDSGKQQDGKQIPPPHLQRHTASDSGLGSSLGSRQLSFGGHSPTQGVHPELVRTRKKGTSKTDCDFVEGGVIGNAGMQVHEINNTFHLLGDVVGTQMYPLSSLNRDTITEPIPIPDYSMIFMPPPVCDSTTSETSLSLIVTPAEPGHSLSRESIDTINTLLLKPLIQNERLDEFKHLCLTLKDWVESGRIYWLRDLEKFLLYRGPMLAGTAESYLHFCNTLMDFLRIVARKIRYCDLHRAYDRPYSNGYFVDALDQAKQLAENSIFASTKCSTKAASPEGPSESSRILEWENTPVFAEDGKEIPVSALQYADLKPQCLQQGSGKRPLSEIENPQCNEYGITKKQKIVTSTSFERVQQPLTFNFLAENAAITPADRRESVSSEAWLHRAEGCDSTLETSISPPPAASLFVMDMKQQPEYQQSTLVSSSEKDSTSPAPLAFPLKKETRKLGPGFTLHNDGTLFMCTYADCGASFPRKCDLTKHEKKHTRPFKCEIPTCKYNKFGFPTDKERERHQNDKHSANSTEWRCQYPPCQYKSKRESNCKQHMEKAHNYGYRRMKRNPRKKGENVCEDGGNGEQTAVSVSDIKEEAKASPKKSSPSQEECPPQTANHVPVSTAVINPRAPMAAPMGEITNIGMNSSCLPPISLPLDYLDLYKAAVPYGSISQDFGSRTPQLSSSVPESKLVWPINDPLVMDRRMSEPIISGIRFPSMVQDSKDAAIMYNQFQNAAVHSDPLPIGDGVSLEATTQFIPQQPVGNLWGYGAEPWPNQDPVSLPINDIFPSSDQGSQQYGSFLLDGQISAPVYSQSLKQREYTLGSLYHNNFQP
ncbi:hypothetical protein RUND412_010393 [Rhizina undulata]